MSLQDARVLRPATLDDALALMAGSDGTPPLPIAGCTDVLVDAHFGKPIAPVFLDLWPLRKVLGGVHWDGHGVRLGALCTYADALADERLHAAAPMLIAASRLVGAAQIQARGTFAGNIENGSPAADAVPALMALDAEVVLQSVRGERKVPLERYYADYRKTVRAPDELITGITLPPSALHAPGQWFRKVGTRAWQAITKVGLAGRFTWRDGLLHDVRVVAVAMAPTITRCWKLEGVLAGKAADDLDDATLRRAQTQDVKPIADIRSNARYRAEVFARLLKEALRATATP
jgi:CO/xanthine dehydrogenase FAD-binding subunit